MIDGKFPDYERIIPDDFKIKAVIKTSEFINSVKVASLFSGKVDDIKLSFISEKKKNFIEIKTESSEVGSQASMVPIRVKGEPKGKVALNNKYLLDGLQNILTDELIFSFNDAHTPLLISPYSEAKRPKDKDFIYLIMPIKG